jgi:putative membrane protein
MQTAQLTQEDLRKIEEAVQQVEARTGGEIVPVLARQSSFYEVALWRAAAVFAALSGILLTIVYLTTDLLLFMPPYLWLLLVLTSALIGMTLVVSAWPVKRLFLGRGMMAARVLDKAKNMFYDHEVHLTEPRTGILIYVSFFEHQAVVLADLGIDELVPEESWQLIIQKLTQGLKQGRTTESICEAIRACGQLLEDSGVHKPIDDDNNLSDEVRINE